MDDIKLIEGNYNYNIYERKMYMNKHFDRFVWRGFEKFHLEVETGAS